MYLSHPVRRMRDDPVEGEDATLIVTADSPDETDDIADALSAYGTVEDHLEFGALRVTVSETAVTDVCQLDGVESVETDNVAGMTGDAGEDV